MSYNRNIRVNSIFEKLMALSDPENSNKIISFHGPGAVSYFQEAASSQSGCTTFGSGIRLSSDSSMSSSSGTRSPSPQSGGMGEGRINFGRSAITTSNLPFTGGIKR